MQNIKRENICACVVLYNPELERLSENLSAICSQVDRIHIVDNGSADQDAITSLLSYYQNTVYTHNEMNRGIAAALNQAVALALEDGFEWLLTLDQDSICSENMVTNYCEANPFRKVAIICPYVINRGKSTFEEYKMLKAPLYQQLTIADECITSGSLIHLSAATAVGGFKESLFIDCVDHEFNYRILKSGYEIIRANSAYLLQEAGEPTKIPLFSWLYKVTNLSLFRRLQFISIYSEFRLYYYTRNARYLRKMKYDSIVMGKTTRLYWAIIRLIKVTLFIL